MTIRTVLTIILWPGICGLLFVWLFAPSVLHIPFLKFTVFIYVLFAPLIYSAWASDRKKKEMSQHE